MRPSKEKERSTSTLSEKLQRRSGSKLITSRQKETNDLHLVKTISKMRPSKDADYASFAEQLRRRSGSKHFGACPTETNDIQLHQGPTYKVIEENLYEDGCPTAAKYFSKLVKQENEIIQTKTKFKKRVRDSHCLLLAIVENVKSAEFGYRMTGDKELTIQLLLQTAHMIQAQDDAFHWLVKEIYSIILKISKEWEEECIEVISRTHFEYGVVLAEKDDEHLIEAICQISKSLETCKGTMWYTNDRDRNILHEDACVRLCELLLRQAKIDSKSHPQKAASWAHKAVLTFEQVGISVNTSLYCIATLRQSEYLINGRYYESAFTVLNGLQNHIMANDAPRNKCEFYLWLGICHFNLSPHRIALRKLKLSLIISENYNYADLKAHALMYLGRIHAQNSSTHVQARQHFIEAKDLFQKLRDFENEKLATFLMAKLRAYQIFPNYIELIKRASWSSFCYLFDLIQWKQKMLPFWNENGELHTFDNEYECLLQEEVEKELTKIID